MTPGWDDWRPPDIADVESWKPRQPESEKPIAPPLDRRLDHLTILHHLGRLHTRIGRKVSELERDRPPNYIEQLEQIADDLKLNHAEIPNLLEDERAFGPAWNYLATHADVESPDPES